MNKFKRYIHNIILWWLLILSIFIVIGKSETTEIEPIKTYDEKVETKTEKSIRKSVEKPKNYLANLPYPENIMTQIKSEAINNHNKNKDLIGLMYMDGMVNEAIAYTPKDMEKYLHLTTDKEEDLAGTPFLSTYGDGTFEGNALIYGHYMMNGSKFGTLMMSMNDYETLKSAKPLVVYDVRTDEFSVYKAESKFPIIDGYEFITLSGFESNEQRAIYNQTLLDKSFYKVETDKEILMKNHLFLQTCTNAEGNHRTVFSFYEIEKGGLAE